MKTVLIIDGSRMQRLIAESMLERNGLMPMSVGDARQGLDLARTLQPDLMLVDAALPDNLGILRRMLSLPRTCDIPVIATGPEALRRRALLHGARSYLAKPLEEPDLMRALARLLGESAHLPAASLPTVSLR